MRVVGQMREYEGRKHVLIYDIAPISDWNELTHHLLQIVLVHLQNTKGPIPVFFVTPLHTSSRFFALLCTFYLIV